MIFKTDDVIFAKIASRLHLDQMQRDLARVFEPMRGAENVVYFLALFQMQLLKEALASTGRQQFGLPTPKTVEMLPFRLGTAGAKVGFARILQAQPYAEGPHEPTSR